MDDILNKEVTDFNCYPPMTVDRCDSDNDDQGDAMPRKMRMHNMPGVVEWLRLLRDHGPQRREEGRSGASARHYGLTDYWVQHKGTHKWMFLATLKEKEKRNPRWYTLVDYGDWREAITPAGRKALETFERGD